jgi:CheY-like chemotaxis protein
LQRGAGDFQMKDGRLPQMRRGQGRKSMHDRLLRVLIVEDDPLVAMDMEDMAEQCGCTVVGPVASVGEALAAIEENPPQGALLDINLGRDLVWPVADLLNAMSIPFLFATAYDGSVLPERLRDRPVLSKPVSVSILAQKLRSIGIACELDRGTPW